MKQVKLNILMFLFSTLLFSGCYTIIAIDGSEQEQMEFEPQTTTTQPAITTIVIMPPIDVTPSPPPPAHPEPPTTTPVKIEPTVTTPSPQTHRDSGYRRADRPENDTNPRRRANNSALDN